MATAEDFFNKLDENQKAEPVTTANGMTVLMTRFLECQTEAKTAIGGGYAFTKAFKLDELRGAVEKLEVSADKAIYEAKILGVSYNLIRERKEIIPFKKTEGTVETSVISEGISKRKIDLPIKKEKFLANDMFFTIRKIDLDEAMKDFSAFDNIAHQGKLFIIESVDPGKKIRKWDDDLYIVNPLQ